MKETCLITGASGFVGQWLRTALLESGFDVRCYDNRPAGVENEIVGEILDRDALEAACEGTRVVCHLVALQSSRKHSWEDFYTLNVRGTESLLEACSQQNVEHFVYFSTELVYGKQTVGRVAEDSATHPRGFYGRSKLMAEDLCRKYAENGLQVTVLRPCNIMGPGKTRVIDKVFDRINENALIPLVGGRDKPWQVIDVRDVAKITAQILKTRLVGIYNVGSPHPPGASQIFSELIRHAKSGSKLLPLPAWLFRSVSVALDLVGLFPLSAEQYHRLSDSWIVDSSKLLSRLKYSLIYDESHSIIDTYDAYLATSHRST